jgi:hypothetical protein
MLNQTLPAGCISDLTFDRWHANELSGREIDALDKHVEQCTSCQKRKATLTKAAQDYLAHYPLPPVAVTAAVVPLGKKWKARRALTTIAGGLAAAATLVLFVHLGNRGHSNDAETRVKGAAHLGFHLKRGQKVLVGEDEMVVHPGDQLRFTVTSVQPTHIAVLSRDGTGTVSEYYPGNGQSRAFDAVRTRSLETSIELDSALGRETLFGVFCEQPFAVEPLRQALTKTGHLPSLPHCIIDTLRFEKTLP